MLKKLFKNNIFLTFLIWIITFGIIYYSSIFLINFDKSLSDKLYSSFVAEKLKVSDKIILARIDDETIKKIGKFPFPRDAYTPIIQNLKEKWVAVIWMDIIFADKWPSQKADIKLAKSFKEAGNIIIWWGILKWWIYQKPYPLFENKVASYGYFQPNVDKNNNKIYSVDTYKNLKNWRYFHFPVQVLRWYYSKLYEKNFYNYYKKDENYFYITPKIKIPAKNWQKFFINFLAKNKHFRSYSFYKFADKKFYNKFPENYFKNKIVIIGYTAKWIKDIFETPEWRKFWVFSHTNFINTVLTKQWKIYFPKNLEYLLLFLLILLSIYFNLSQRWKKLLYSNLAIISIFSIIIYIIVSFEKNALNFPFQFILTLTLTLTTSNILKSYLEDKNKTLLNKALSQYVSKNIANEILNWEGKVKLDWERKKISIFFSDIQWFTTISEKMNPEELVVFLREYLWAMSNIIMDNKGFIDKYEWDAIMALWWVFWYEKTSNYDNCLSAIKQQKKLQILNQDWEKRFGEKLKIRMWINSWEAIIWNIWAKWRKMEFTALGDSVNLASRLEEVNKKYGTFLCVSENVYNDVKWDFDFRYLDQIRVKWKKIPVKIYELLSIKWELSQLKKSIVEKFEKAISLYLERNFSEALKIFEELSLLWDNPSKTYISRCKIFIETPPEENWDWVWTMKTK